MAKFNRGVGAAAALIVSSLMAMPAVAAHLFVSQFGNDGTGTGTPLAPYLTLQGAINDAQSGDVIQLEQGGSFGPAVIVNKTLTILSKQGGGIFEPGGNAITFTDSGGDDVLTIDGLVIDQGGNANNNGIVFNSGEKLNVQNTVIQNGSGTGSGILFRPTTNAEINIINSTISEFGTAPPGGGVRIQPQSNASVSGLFDEFLSRNTRIGVSSTVTGNSVVSVVLDQSDLTGTSIGVFSSGANSTVRVKDSTIANNALGVFVASNGKVVSLGGNSLRANGTNGTFTAFEAQQ